MHNHTRLKKSNFTKELSSTTKQHQSKETPFITNVQAKNETFLQQNSIEFCFEAKATFGLLPTETYCTQLAGRQMSHQSH